MPLRALVERALRRLRRALRRSPSQARGAVDGVEAGTLFGWASHGAEPVAVELRHGDRALLGALATGERPDVQAAGVAPLRCGFRFSLEEAITGLAGFDGGGALPLRVYAGGVALPGVELVLTRRDLMDAAALSWAAKGTG